MISIENLGTSIASNSAVVEKWLASQNGTTLSFEPDADPEFPPTVDVPDIEAARLKLLEDLGTMQDLLSGPGEVLRRIAWHSNDLAVQQCLYHFKFLEAIPIDGSASYAELSAKVGLTEPQVKALVRQSAMNRVLREASADRVEHTAASALLLRDRIMMDWYGHCLEEVFPSAAKLAEALEKFKGSAEQHDCAFALAFNTSEPFYKFIEHYPDRQERFFNAMEAVGRGYGHKVDHVAHGYPWSELGAGAGANIVDIGGSSGFMTSAIAKVNPNLTKLVVQDYKHVVEEGAAQLPAELKGRVEFMPHDFFNLQPVKGADVYIMRHICHNWTTEMCAKIIQQIVPVMKPTSKILLVEVVVLPQNQESSHVAERYMRYVDVAMMEMLNTQERSEEEWRKVVSAADPSLELTRIFKPKGSWDSIIEISPKLN